MSSPAYRHPNNSQVRSKLGIVGFYLGLCVVGLAGVSLLVLGANPLLALIPMGIVASGFLVSQVPLRYPTNALLAGMLVLDESQEAGDKWVSPLAVIGDLLHYRLDLTIPVPGGVLSGMELAVLLLLAVRIYRAGVGAKLDEGGRVETASVIRDLIILYLLGVFYAEFLGLVRGLGAVPYKLRNLVHPLLLTGLFIAAFRGPKDARFIGKLIVFAACVKSILAYTVQRIAIAETGGTFRAAISHGDSMIFAIAFVIIVLRYLEDPRREQLIPSLLILSIITLGCVQNNRRIVWVMIAASFLAAYLIRPLAGWQRIVTKVSLVAVPFFLIYTAIGWSSSSRIFAPVQILRGVADTSHDTSAYWREVETWNIAVSTRGSALIGMGLGGEYIEYMPNDDVSEIYKEYREWPHNTVMGLLMLMGLFGFTAHWVLLPTVMFLSVRSYWMAHSSEARLLALSCIASVVSCLVMAWGDTGAHYPQFKIFAALSICFAAKLSVATGSWPGSSPDPERVDLIKA